MGSHARQVRCATLQVRCATSTKSDPGVLRPGEPTVSELDERLRIARRAFLRVAALAGSAGPLSGHAGGTAEPPLHGGNTDEQPLHTDEQPLHTGVHTGPDALGSRPLVVYRRPVRDERTICAASVSWRHRVVVPPGDGSDAIYVDLFAAERFPAGTVLELVDRLSACPGTEETLIFFRRVASPDGG